MTPDLLPPSILKVSSPLSKHLVCNCRFLCGSDAFHVSDAIVDLSSPC
uniref:Uncharacterized protein n=1 Tax=Arundo donax TaxID=35708 RepID=A0A0A8YQV5_ARUDO